MKKETVTLLTHKDKRPVCPKCKKPMRLWATGLIAFHYRCDDCTTIKLVEKEKHNAVNQI